jgi:hypothetical protein
LNNAEGKNRKGGPKLKVIKTALIIFIISAAVGCAAGIMKGRGLLPDFLSKKETVDVSVLNSKVKEISELTTVRYDYREIVEKKSSGVLDKMYLMTYDGTIKAGIDVDEAVFHRVKKSDGRDSVTVELPAAKIISHDDSNFHTVYEKGFDDGSLGSERNKLIDKKKKEAEERALKDGLLDRAEKRAEKVITEMITNTYGSDIKVRFETKEAAE